MNDGYREPYAQRANKVSISLRPFYPLTEGYVPWSIYDLVYLLCRDFKYTDQEIIEMFTVKRNYEETKSLLAMIKLGEI